MGLRCLLGHDFGEPETERKRNEDGNEVVVTVREVKTCDRCGEKQVVSENKEIKSIDQLRETVNVGEPTTGDSSVGGADESDGFGLGSDAAGLGEDSPSAGIGDDSGPGDDSPSTGIGGEDSVSSGLGTGASTDTSSSNDAAEQWQAEELTPDSDDEETAPDADDDDDLGVAELIESAEQGDDMLQPDEDEPTPQPPSEADADQQSLDESSEPDASEEDAVILDDDISPEAGREQWDEQAAPEEVPGREDIQPEPDEDEDAIIIDESDPDEPDRDEPSEPEPEAPDAGPTEPEPESPDVEQTEPEPEAPDAGETEPVPEPPDVEQTEPEPDSSTTEPSDVSHTAVEDEDAIIMGGEEEEEPVQSELDDAVPEPTDEPGGTSEPAADEPDGAHSPWPETPEEDAGHDATAPDGEPADIDFGGSITPEEAENERNGAAESASQPDDSQPSDGPSEPAAESSPTQSAPEPNINLERSRREAKLEYYCSECGLTREVGNSSMRAGDICPDCRQGYISEQQKSD